MDPDVVPHRQDTAPEPCSAPVQSLGPCSVPQLLREAIGHGLSTLLAIWTAAKVLAYLPDCLRLVVQPSGQISHDPWAWAPLVLDLAAAVAVASPVSFRSLLDFARSVRPQPRV